jgi:hypothetical protein
VVVFNEPDYPWACSGETLASLVPGAYVPARAGDLAAKLAAGCGTLISFQGPYFPKAAWPAIQTFLEGGGNLAVFGGMPFSRPVNEKGHAEPEQEAYTRALYLGPFFMIEPGLTNLGLIASEAAAFLEDCALSLPAGQSGDFWAFDPKLTQTSDHTEELGSAGPIDTVLTPLIFATAKNADSAEITRIATPAMLLDQRQGQFQGGRWLLSPWRPSSEKVWLDNAPAIQKLIRLAIAGLDTLDVRPALACLQPGETPSLVLAARTSNGFKVHLKMVSPGQSESEAPGPGFDIDFPASPGLQEKRISLPGQTQPGLYKVEVIYQTPENLSLRQTTGFWVWDTRLVEATQGQRLTAGRDYFYQDGKPFLVYGTTYMDSAIQRRFLTLPNPARWDRDFAEMKAAGINLIRTGLWTAWRQFMPLAGVAGETALRSLDALVMTACKYNIQLVFNFFAFYPPLFEGFNPWLDPRSVRAQQDFVGLLARRYASIELVSWDLINEPSFGDPKKIFSQRPLPNYDRFELEAFRRWLQARYNLDELQQRWGLTSQTLATWEQVNLPEPADYSTNVRDNSPHNMCKAADYTLFSQDEFTRWAAIMTQTIREAGSQTLVGVGQDEAGVRLAPQFYAAGVDYTTTHPWWNNDALLWDMLLDKTPFKPNLIQETGVMLVTDVDGRPWRTPQENAHLLERKLLNGLAARGAGLVQWLWHTNAYMTSDNENSIGLVRADGSAKPELAAMREFGRLAQALEGQLQETAQLPEIWLVIPYAQWAIRPELGQEATRQAVRILGYDFGVIPQLVAEQKLAELVKNGQKPRAVIVPGMQFLDGESWESLQTLAENGATVLINGVIRKQPDLFASLEGNREVLTTSPVSRYETLRDLDGQPHQLIFDGEKIGYVQKAHNQCKIMPIGEGKIIWSGLPLELSTSASAIRRIYEQVFSLSIENYQQDSPLLVTRQALAEGELVIVVSESAEPQKVSLDNGLSLEIAPNRAGAAIVKDGKAATFGGLSLIATPSLVAS